MIGTNYCTGKFRITNEEELKAFEAITYNIWISIKVILLPMIFLLI